MFRVFSLLAPEMPTTDGKLASPSLRIAFFCTVFYCYYLEVVFLLLKGLVYLQRKDTYYRQ